MTPSTLLRLRLWRRLRAQSHGRPALPKQPKALNLSGARLEDLRSFFGRKRCPQRGLYFFLCLGSFGDGLQEALVDAAQQGRAHASQEALLPCRQILSFRGLHRRQAPEASRSGTSCCAICGLLGPLCKTADLSCGARRRSRPPLRHPLASSWPLTGSTSLSTPFPSLQVCLEAVLCLLVRGEAHIALRAEIEKQKTSPSRCTCHGACPVGWPSSERSK